jgi:ABC-type multidrug transport system fused ATPase/permease subunit
MAFPNMLALSVPETGLPAPRGLWGLFLAYRGRIVITYVLFNLENLVRLAQPLVLCWAINDLLHASYRGLLLFTVQHLLHLLLGGARRMYDVRAFTQIYADIATALIHKQRQHGVETSAVAARSVLSRDLVDFFERDVPTVLAAVYSVIGALIMLLWYDWLIAPMCLAMLVPLGLINRIYSRQTLVLTGRLHDRLEREVDVIERARPRGLRKHFGLLSRLHIMLTDCEAINFGLMEAFILGLISLTLIRSCHMPDTDAGSIFAVFRYVLIFVMGLDGVPMLVRQFSRLRDIIARLRELPAQTPCGISTAGEKV